MNGVIVYGFLFLDVFFFFKQKTAYDVRISDWSSDVCSSDLCHSMMSLKRSYDTAPAGGQATVFGRGGEGGKSRQMTPFPRSRARSSGLRSSSSSKIGRASCRARVCKYVYIAVGDVFLRKKNYKHNLNYNNIQCKY